MSEVGGRGWTYGVIGWCWGGVALLWLVAAFFAKRTAARSNRPWVLYVGVLIVVALVIARDERSSLLYSPRGALGDACVGIVAVGVVITVWARLTLGRNWSGSVVVKEDHELIQSGPYRFVRHPIYTGLLTMFLGTVIDEALAVGFVAFVVVAVALVAKLRREEALMTQQFPDQYPRYRARTRALVPFVL